ncbi:uncharacterized protein KY384_004517 [Bacidia gigantensis]|uniref:uncharacterized protein n=1 Tax=Bacidia gigantensis TaxID=2732470 RepID=UPI001D038046|nr:uncharacterized protein KY384_004517 [Bacidia gigantensis]KAG8531159.1 hypothetical protein KY384_004517 [Bacidia gigantensis]
MVPDIHSPLENLLLLLALYPYDGESYTPSFDHASNSLRGNKILEESDFFKPERLGPETLRGLYLGLVKEQAKIEAASHNGSPSTDPNPRKRKLSSPPMETIEEASKYTHLLPRLLERLYIQFKDDTTKTIEAEEREYRKMQSLQHHTSEARAARPGSQGVPPISALLRETEGSAQPRPPAPVEPIVNGIGQHETHPPPHEPRNLHADIYNPRSQPSSAENGPPYLPPPAPPTQPYTLPSSGIDRRTSTQNQGPSASPRLSHAPLPHADRSSASPIILPPPKGMVRSSGSPPMPSPQQAHYPSTRQPSNQSTPHIHSQRPYSGYYDTQGYPIPYSPYAHSPASQMYHSYHPHTAHSTPYGAQSYQSPVAAQQSPYYTQYSQPLQTPYAQTPPQYTDSRTPVTNPLASQKTPKPSPISITGSVTKWKKIEKYNFGIIPVSPTRPQAGDISPISDVDPFADHDRSVTSKRGGRSTRSSREQLQGNESLVNDRRTERPRGGRGRGPGRGRSRRAGSVGSSTFAGSSRRSHSPTDEQTGVKPEPSTAADENVSVASFNTADESSRKPARPRRGTLRGMDVDSQRPTSKRKRDELSATSTPKGKQATVGTPGLTPVTPKRPTKRPGYILATRNFPKLTLPLMTEITTHRLASLFAKPLTEREAPGYKDRVYRPQDLKSVKAAVSAGSKALTAVLEGLGDEAPTTGAHIWVPENEDLMPPKGIVNAGQLEKELMRIFANAVMFNPDISENRGLGPAFRTRRKAKESSTVADPESDENQHAGTATGKFEIGVAAPIEGAVVQDTRTVARDAQESFAAWRAVESERDDDVVDLGGPAAQPTEDGGEVGDAEEEVKESVEEEGEGERRSKRRRR